MKILALATLVVYAVALTFIFSYSLVQMNLVWNYLNYHRRKRTSRKQAQAVSLQPWPKVTVQLPVYNELYVVVRLLDSMAALDYPADMLEIQVLDDSNDESVQLISTKVAELKSRGINMHHVRRVSRQGYKAGALDYGFQRASGEFIAIFDSDFIPSPDFLKRTLTTFDDPEIGAVQTRWTHINKDYSLLTRLQAFGLDAHFSIEQTGRNAAGHFMNFNGTAGVWRKSCIADAGGWQSDTLTEDLDLSYRAQLKGWKFRFLEEVASPAELPVTMNALKNQQFRWNKGAAECVRKNLPQVLGKKGISTATKMHAVFHLMNSSVFIAIMITALLSVPLLWIKSVYLEWHWIFLFASFFLFSFLLLGSFYFSAFAQQDKHFPGNILRFLARFPLFLSVSMGLALHNAIAVSEGYLGKKSSFVRTPKFNISAAGQSWKSNRYLARSVSSVTVLEIILALYFSYGIYLAFRLHDFGLFPFHIMLAFGFGFVSFFSVFHSRGIKVHAHANS